MVKYYAAEMSERVTSEALQIMGGAGYTTLHAVEALLARCEDLPRYLKGAPRSNNGSSRTRCLENRLKR